MPVEDPIPYFDLTRQYSHYRGKWIEQIERLGQSGNFILGDAVAQVESNLAEFLGVRHAVAVSSGTDAIVLALRAAGVKPGDSVIVPNFTFYASVEAVSLAGAEPRLVDINVEDFNIDPDKIKNAVDSDVAAIIPVHLFGLPANMHEIRSIAHEHGLQVIEDVAQAFGSQVDNTYCGAIGDFGCFSFYPTKILGAYGDGGMVTTNSDDHAEKLRLLRNHGIVGPGQHNLIGCTSRLDAVQAVLLDLKLKPVNEAIRRRRELADQYTDQLQDCDLVLPADLPGRSHVYNIFTIRSQHRDRIAQSLTSAQIGYQIYYTLPVHRQIPYQHLGYTDDEFTGSMQACDEVVSLPLYPEMADSHVERICEVIRGAIA